MPRFFMQLDMNEELYKLGITFFLTTRGIPQIYYGSEILMTHTEGDHHGYIRKDFPGGWEGDNVNAFTGEGLSENEAKMQDFFKKLLNWRKNCEIIHSGKLIHFAPDGGIYTYGRYNEDGAVVVFLNKNESSKILELDRFKEFLGAYTSGKDVVSGRSYLLDNTIEIPAITGLVLELNK